MACDAPLTIRYKNPIPDGSGGFIWTFPADCGKCLNCLTKRKAQWSFRLVEEKRNSFSSYFVTLTYDDDHLTIGDGQATINPNDHTLFIKNLKKLENKKVLSSRKMVSPDEIDRKRRGIKEVGKLKYYGVSEYGDLYGRPHWHYILFNVRDTNNINLAWSDTLCCNKSNNYIPEVGKPFGKVEIDECNINTIDYVLKYMIKDHSGNDWSDRQKEVRRMSKGLGDSYVFDDFKNYINRPDGNVVQSQRGHKVALPRYFRKKYVTEENLKKKALYINSEVMKRDVKLEREYGKELDKTVALGKDQRAYLLKKRQKRNKT